MRLVEENTEFGPIRRKYAEGYGVSRSKYEYDDLAEAAKKNGKSVREILDAVSGKK